MGLYQTGSLITGIDGKVPNADGKVLTHTDVPMEISVDGKKYNDSRVRIGDCCHGLQMKKITN